MKLAIDTNCRRVTRAGTTRYLDGLLHGFRETLPDLEVQEIEWPVDNLDYRQPARALKTFYRELGWAPFIGAARVRDSGCDVFHSPAGFLIPPPGSIPHVATLHDLAILRHPERYRKWQRLCGRARLEKTCSAQYLIGISEFTISEAVSLLGIPSSRFVRIFHGCDFNVDSPESPPSAFAAPDEFLLFVGSLEPGKNLALLREVYVLAGERGNVLPPLVVVGARWEGVGHEGVWPESWIAAGRLPDNQLVYLYRRALAHVFPSSYEGFGFPPLEAMTLGCPVICSRVASLPEVTREAALYAELTPESYLNSILRLLSEDGLRDDLIRRGSDQAQRFSWGKCAKETLEVYKLAAKI